MNTQQKKILFSIIMCCSILLLYPMVHEDIHMQIYKHYNIPAKVVVELPFTIYTQADTTNVTLEDYNEARRLNMQAEIVGYNIGWLGLLIFAVGMTKVIMSEE